MIPFCKSDHSMQRLRSPCDTILINPYSKNGVKQAFPPAAWLASTAQATTSANRLCAIAMVAGCCWALSLLHVLQTLDPTVAFRQGTALQADHVHRSPRWFMIGSGFGMCRGVSKCPTYAVHVCKFVHCVGSVLEVCNAMVAASGCCWVTSAYLAAGVPNPTRHSSSMRQRAETLPFQAAWSACGALPDGVAGT
jgi:hypothetical protein